MKYTSEQRLRAVRVYRQYDRSATSVTDGLGYPSRGMLARWYREWVGAARDDGRSLDDGRGNATCRSGGALPSTIISPMAGVYGARSAHWDIPVTRCWHVGSTSWSRDGTGCAARRWKRRRGARRWRGMHAGRRPAAGLAKSWACVPMSCETGSAPCSHTTTRSTRCAMGTRGTSRGRSACTDAGNVRRSSHRWRFCGPNASTSRSRWRPSDAPRICWEKGQAQTRTTQPTVRRRVWCCI